MAIYNIILNALIILCASHFTYAQSDSSGFDELISFSVESMPQYNGSEEGMLRFIKSQINYSAIYKIEKEQTVIISFLVDTLGNTSSHFVLKGIRGDLDKEALRVVRMIKFEVPAKQKGKPIQVQYFIPVKFLPR
ncbi:hypothetical protein GCM10027275_41350 [Rhabdobacter roseus]|uniref:TonB family protein n=1 Tax=Rhabdobacter roseus TaxID=1655419 RepID=A0A840U1V0_9BACT|nr:TonB family protein [Rhabdobacter roseus]MBB5286110.1 TonB family protein [Rhabdobacter roseus]